MSDPILHCPEQPARSACPLPHCMSEFQQLAWLSVRAAHFSSTAMSAAIDTSRRNYRRLAIVEVQALLKQVSVERASEALYCTY
jgi:hypothetical protein